MLCRWILTHPASRALHHSAWQVDTRLHGPLFHPLHSSTTHPPMGIFQHTPESMHPLLLCTHNPLHMQSMYMYLYMLVCHLQDGMVASCPTPHVQLPASSECTVEGPPYPCNGMVGGCCPRLHHSVHSECTAAQHPPPSTRWCIVGMHKHAPVLLSSFHPSSATWCTRACPTLPSYYV
jgi:hypothetical protein